MRLRLVLLGGQTLCLGLTSSFLIVAATSVFLSVYGAALLPYAYITVAVAGLVVSSAMTRAQRRLSLAGLAEGVISVVALMMLAGWAALSLAGQTWVTFPLVVLIFLWIPVGFVLVGAQSGRLLDVQQLKAYFPRIAAGFAAGFMLGGIGAARLVSVLGSPEDLLLVDALIALVLLGLVVTTARLHPAQLRQPPAPPAVVDAGPVERPSLRSLLANRFVVVLLGYQLLSAAVTQLLDYLVWQAAAERYPDPADLARFLGFFGAVINGVGLLFVFTLAGVLLSRYGVRFGLAANPAGVLVFVVASTIVSLAGGQGTTLFFLLLCTQQVVDIVLTDGTTRGSINAAYQALPPLERLAAQTRVEGVGVPGAVGFVGVLLLVAGRLQAGVVALLVIVLLLTLAWIALAVSAYRLYGANLRRTITRRAWDPVALRLDDDASRAVVARLLASDDARDVAVALDAFAATSPDDVLPHVESLLRDPDPDRRRVAVDATVRHRVAGAVPVLLVTATDQAQPGPLRAAAVRAAAVLGAPTADLAPMPAERSDDVRASAAVALLHGRGSVGDADRVRELLSEGGSVAQPTLLALAELPHPLAVPPLLELAALRQPPAALPDALAAHGALLLPAARAALSDGRAPRPYAARLVRAVAQAHGAGALLLEHVDHLDRGTRTVVLRALSSRGDVVDDADGRLRNVLLDETARTAHALDALDVLGHEPAAEDLCRALRDEVRDAAGRCSMLLALLHDPVAVPKAVAGLNGAGRPLALETLEVTLGRADDTLARALLDATLTEPARRSALEHVVPVEHKESHAWLQELALDPSGRWREPWLRAAALWALVRSDWSGVGSVASSAASDEDPVVAETARAAFTR